MMHLLLVKISIWSAWLSWYWQCPVRKLVILFNLVVPISMRILNLLKFQPFKSSFLACLSSSASLQTLSLLVAITLYSSSLQESICKAANIFLSYQGNQCPECKLICLLIPFNNSAPRHLVKSPLVGHQASLVSAYTTKPSLT